MFWEIEIPLIIRNLINDLADPPTYSDDRILQLSVISAQYVLTEVTLDRNYSANVVSLSITPDPSDPEIRDITFIGLVAMKAACLLDLSTFRTKAAGEGLRAALGPASLSISGGLSGYKDILKMGPCALYDQLVMDQNVGNAPAVAAILSPFVGNNFDPQNLRYSNSYRNKDMTMF
jgi:hypothetical protein